MVSLAAQAVRLAYTVLQGSHGLTATYCRGAAKTVDLTVVPGGRQTTIQNQEGDIVQSRDRDILIEAQDLVINNFRILPERFDVILLKDESGIVYETLRVDNAPSYTNSDPYGIVFRVHAKQVETVPDLTADVVWVGDSLGGFLVDSSGAVLSQ